MLEFDPNSLTYLAKPRKPEGSKSSNETKFDNKWLRAKRAANLGGSQLQILTVSGNDIVTNGGLWKFNSNQENCTASAIVERSSDNYNFHAEIAGIHQIQPVKNGPSYRLMITCSRTKVVATLLDKEVFSFIGNPTILAEDLGQVSSLSVDSKGDWLALGLGYQVWVLKLHWTKKCEIHKVDHYATFEGHRSSISGLHFINDKLDTKLISVSHDRTFNIWSVEKLECLYESPLLGNYSLTSSNILRSLDGTLILALGNCDGTLYFFEVFLGPDESSAKKVGRIPIEFRNSSASSTISITKSASAEAVTVKPMRNRRAQSKETPVKLFTSPDKQTDNNDQLSQVTCEILDLVQIPNPNKLWLLAGTSVGLALVNLGSKAVESTATFENIRRTEAILSAITSSIKMGNSSPGAKDGVVHVVAQFSTDGKTAAFPIHVSSEKRFDDTVSIVAKDQPKGFFAQIQKNNEAMNGKESSACKAMMKPGNFGKRILAIASARRIQSSGYGKTEEKRKLFKPKTNKCRRKSKSESRLQSKSAWESNDEGFISPSSSTDDLSEYTTDEATVASQPRQRQKWKSPTRLKTTSSSTTKLTEITEPKKSLPSKMTACVKMWQTDGVHSSLFFSAQGQALAASGAHNSVQMISSSTLMKLQKMDDFTRCDTIEKGSRLMGHIAPVNSVDFANESSDILVTSGRDRAVKIWHWKSKTVKLNIDLRKQGRGTGLGKNTVFGSVYGGITAKPNSSQLLQKKNKKSAKYDDAMKPFPDSVAQAQFYYMDQFLISASSNKLYVHQLGLPSHQTLQKSGIISSDDFWFKFVHTSNLTNCKNITAISAPNQFFSYQVICGCSDRSLRMLDLNSDQVSVTIPQCHSKPINRIIQGKSSEYSVSSIPQNVFLTTAMGDGAKMWDVRLMSTNNCVQKFDWPGSNSGRIQLGVDLSPTMQFLAAGSDDGSVYVYDIRKPCGGYVQRLVGGSSKPVPNHANHGNGYNRSPVTDVTFHPGHPNVLLASTLDGELIKFE